MSGEEKSGQPSYRSGSLERNRKDSGFADSQVEQPGVHDSKLHSKAPADESTMAADRTAEIYNQDTRRQGKRTAFDSRPPSRECPSSISTASPATSIHTHPLSRKSTSGHRTPRISLTHSASASYRPPSVYNRSRPAMSIRTSSAPQTHYRAKDPLTFHHNSCRLFQSLGAHLPYHQRSPGASSCEGLTSINLNSSRRCSSPARPSTGAASDALESPSPDAVPTKSTPPTTIHWTSTSSRRREYEQIDQCHRGIRGWWRRVAPRWCPRSRSTRTAFYDGDSDGGSVRRYRLELPDGDEDSYDDEQRDVEKTATSVHVTEPAKMASPISDRSRNSWSCFNFRDR